MVNLLKLGKYSQYSDITKLSFQINRKEEYFNAVVILNKSFESKTNRIIPHLKQVNFAFINYKGSVQSSLPQFNQISDEWGTELRFHIKIHVNCFPEIVKDPILSQWLFEIGNVYTILKGKQKFHHAQTLTQLLQTFNRKIEHMNFIQENGRIIEKQELLNGDYLKLGFTTTNITETLDNYQYELSFYTNHLIVDQDIHMICNFLKTCPLRQRDKLVQLTLLNINYCDGIINELDVLFKYLTNVQILHYQRKGDNLRRQQIQQILKKQELAIQQLDLRQVIDVKLYSKIIERYHNLKVLKANRCLKQAITNKDINWESMTLKYQIDCLEDFSLFANLAEKLKVKSLCLKLSDKFQNTNIIDDYELTLVSTLSKVSTSTLKELNVRNLLKHSLNTESYVNYIEVVSKFDQIQKLAISMKANSFSLDRNIQKYLLKMKNLQELEIYQPKYEWQPLIQEIDEKLLIQCLNKSNFPKMQKIYLTGFWISNMTNIYNLLKTRVQSCWIIVEVKDPQIIREKALGKQVSQKIQDIKNHHVVERLTDQNKIQFN
ncbi:Regulator of telomere elongation helicase 1 [Oxytricha trifallax]|uniref:Regulator of telomere elongation helicase 1 n=1 Tax=Oxytricha trifallax TaxID=1172189 RepID=A0A073I0A3_9SPIT|nr:Regulator of telomere elongation helicase 1 [Oxytricha trifallax]